MKTIYTFWEGEMPSYIKLCLDSWRLPYILLTYENVNKYTDIDIEPLKRFPLMLVADYIRVHVLRDNGGIWLDADSIMVTDKLPDGNIVGDPVERTNSICYLQTEPNSDMFTKWADWQDKKVSNPNCSTWWSTLGNEFTDSYVKTHTDVQIAPIGKHWPETYMVNGPADRMGKYLRFYFTCRYHLADIQPIDLIFLHNSWTPKSYKRLSEEYLLGDNCTMSNILKEVRNI